jgi:hypothetical protein
MQAAVTPSRNAGMGPPIYNNVGIFKKVFAAVVVVAVAVAAVAVAAAAAVGVGVVVVLVLVLLIVNNMLAFERLRLLLIQ